MRISKPLGLLIFFALLGYFTFLINIDQMQNHMVFYVFQSRDIARAVELLKGHWLYFGPEMTGGGNLPGSLYYFILAAFLAMGSTWMAAWWGMVALAAVGAVSMWYFLRSRGMMLGAFLWLSLFIDSAHTQHILSIFINPSYLFIFAIALMILAILITTHEKSEAREMAYYSACLLTGLAVQVHFSIFFVFLAILFMQRFATKLKLPQLPKRTFYLGLIWFVLPLIPFAIWYFMQETGESWGQPTPYSGQAGGVWPTFIYLLGALKNMSLENLARVLWVQTLKVVPWSLPLLWLTIILAGKKGKDAEESKPQKRMLKPLLICMGFAFIPFSYVYFVPIANRYGMAFNLSLILLTVILQSAFLVSRRRLILFNCLASAGLIALWAWSLNEFPKNTDADWIRLGCAVLVGAACFYFVKKPTRHRLGKIGSFTLILALSQFQSFAIAKSELPLIQSNMSSAKLWAKIWSRIECSGGWSYEVAREKLYFVNAHIDEDPRMGFEWEQLSAPVEACHEAVPDGFIIGTNVPANADFHAWLLEQPIADEIKQGLRAGNITLGDVEGGRAWVAPYFVKREADLPRHFHNVALAYEPSPELEVFNKISQDEGVKEISPGRFLFKWNDCPDHNEYCNHGAVVSAQSHEAGVYQIQIRILGAPLSQVSPWIHPTWTQAVNEPFLEISCGGEVKSFALAKSVGFKREYLYIEPVTQYFLGNNSLIAPFERDYTVKCSGAIEELTYGFKSSTVDRLRSTSMLPGSKLSVAP